LGLFDGVSFANLGLIVADVHMAYLAPIALGQNIRVGVRVACIGHKSMTFEYRIEDEATAQPLATAEIVMVAYDYHTYTNLPVSAAWREKIAKYESKPQHAPNY
jgi:acyl-CoA thioester hydrolase